MFPVYCLTLNSNTDSGLSLDQKSVRQEIKELVEITAIQVMYSNVEHQLLKFSVVEMDLVHLVRQFLETLSTRLTRMIYLEQLQRLRVLLV